MTGVGIELSQTKSGQLKNLRVLKSEEALKVIEESKRPMDFQSFSQGDQEQLQRWKLLFWDIGVRFCWFLGEKC